jgi:hypothetical protein
LREDSGIVTTKKPKTDETELIGKPADIGVRERYRRAVIIDPHRMGKVQERISRCRQACGVTEMIIVGR